MVLEDHLGLKLQHGDRDIVIPIFVPPILVNLVNDLHEYWWQDSPRPLTPALNETNQLGVQEFLNNLGIDLIPVFWRLDGCRLWQLFDRRVDE